MKVIMKTRDFCYWLQGFFELSQDGMISPNQARAIKDHLSMVFIHDIDPSFPISEQKALTTAHNKDLNARC